ARFCYQNIIKPFFNEIWSMMSNLVRQSWIFTKWVCERTLANLLFSVGVVYGVCDYLVESSIHLLDRSLQRLFGLSFSHLAWMAPLQVGLSAALSFAVIVVSCYAIRRVAISAFAGLFAFRESWRRRDTRSDFQYNEVPHQSEDNTTGVSRIQRPVTHQFNNRRQGRPARGGRIVEHDNAESLLHSSVRPHALTLR
ncbi:MAG TPA: hypothetical protein VJ205_03090, partial [Gammaproteobacteria bacterium]|nr:hypothetical protein [Gammaproteobacteria bacterium]